VYIADSSVRKCLKEVLKGSCSVDDFTNRIGRLTLAGKTTFAELLKDIAMVDCTKNEVSVPHSWVSFIKSCISTSPVCSYIFPSETVETLITKMESITSSPSLLEMLQKEMPLVFALVKSERVLPRSFYNVLQELWSVSTSMFSGFTVPQSPAHCSANDAMTIFPKMPPIRVRAHYSADKNTRSTICTKRYLGHPSLLPGIFTLFCQHGICYGYQVMEVKESPGTAFTILLTRFARAPKLIIYDNACNLHTYCLNREPLFFKETRFLVDRFHWPNHTGCSAAYELSSYPQFSNINSQTVEQANAAIQRIKSSLSYMNQINFCQHLSFYMWYRNKQISEGPSFTA
jgi:hypothetical protein